MRKSLPAVEWRARSQRWQLLSWIRAGILYGAALASFLALTKLDGPNESETAAAI